MNQWRRRIRHIPVTGVDQRRVGVMHGAWLDLDFAGGAVRLGPHDSPSLEYTEGMRHDMAQSRDDSVFTPLTIFTPSMSSLFFSRSTARTLPCWPACGPCVTCTRSPRTIFHLFVSATGFFFWMGFIKYFPNLRPQWDRCNVEFISTNNYWPLSVNTAVLRPSKNSLI